MWRLLSVIDLLKHLSYINLIQNNGMIVSFLLHY